MTSNCIIAYCSQRQLARCSLRKNLFMPSPEFLFSPSHYVGEPLRAKLILRVLHIIFFNCSNNGMDIFCPLNDFKLSSAKILWSVISQRGDNVNFQLLQMTISVGKIVWLEGSKVIKIEGFDISAFTYKQYIHIGKILWIECPYTIESTTFPKKYVCLFKCPYCIGKTFALPSSNFGTYAARASAYARDWRVPVN